MRRLVQKRGLRGGIGLLAAYFLALQTFFATVALTEAAAVGALASDSVFVICTSNADGTGGHTGADVGHTAKCCLYCAVAAAATFAFPEAGTAPARVGASAPAHFYVRSAPLASVWSGSRGGPARAPPPMV